MNIKYLILFAIIFYSCEEPVMQAENTQDPDSGLHIPGAKSIVIESYSPSSIRLTFNNQDSQDSIAVLRIENGDSSSFSIIKNSDEYFIDNQNIVPNNNYNYSARYITESGQSDSIAGSISHVFLGIDNLILDAINENSINISWEYDIQENFEKSYEDLNWEIVRQKYNSVSDNWDELENILFSASVSLDNHYEYLDTENIELDDHLKYSVSLKIDNLNSDITSDSIEIDFPQLESLFWIPINSSAIGIDWSIDASASNDAISSVTISNNFNDQDDFIYQGTEISGFFIDSLANANVNIFPNQQVEYKIKWCGLSDCMDSIFTAYTFPVYNMQYVPAMTGIDFNGNTLSTEAFYIDIYEVHENIFNNNDNSSIEPMLSMPKSDINMQDARDYCNRRSESYSQEDFGYGYTGANFTNDLGFRLPTESEWYVAAAVLHNWNGETIDIFEYTTQVGSGSITCSYGNILNCGDEAKTVGSYSGNSECASCLESTSPNGLYDCNGNLKEWVEKSEELHSPNHSNRGVIIGGDFTSTANQSKNSFFMYEELDFEHSTIGFRTIIPAAPFLSSIHEE